LSGYALKSRNSSRALRADGDQGAERNRRSWQRSRYVPLFVASEREARDMPVTYHVVVVFDRDEDGDPKPGEARETTNATAGERTARALSGQHAGAVASTRTGDPATGEFQDGVVLAQFGDVDLDALSS
jgi:hypothetical protein